MQSTAFTLSVAILLVFLASSSSYEDDPTSLPYWMNTYYVRATIEPFRDWLEETTLPYWMNPYYFQTIEEPLQLTAWWEEDLDSDSVTPTPLPYFRILNYFETTQPAYMVTSDIPDPSVEVYQQVGNSDSLIVVCQFKKKTSKSSFHLSVRNSDGKRMLNNPACIAKTTCVFNVTATPPVSFTCVHVVSAHTDIQTLLSDVVIYQPHKQLSSAYIGFASFIGVGLVILVIMLVVTTLKTRRKVSRREVKENVYEHTEII